MTSALDRTKEILLDSTRVSQHSYFLSLCAGLLIPCGFAPIHLPGLTLLGLALLFTQLNTLIQDNPRHAHQHALILGIAFGLGFFGIGVSWVFVSIKVYGHLNTFISAGITILFVLYLSIFTSLMTFTYCFLARSSGLIWNSCLFSALWCLSEWLRSSIGGGFPWLQLGVSQVDTPLKYLLPVIGLYGTGFVTCLSATVLSTILQNRTVRHRATLIFVAILLAPTALKFIHWTKTDNVPISVSVIQANLSMRDKWDEQLFWKLIRLYSGYLDQLIGKRQVIVMPESAIPVPPSFMSDFLQSIHEQAKRTSTAVIMGLPQPVPFNDTRFYNALVTFGAAKGHYYKQHLVPFGEYIPPLFQKLTDLLSISVATTEPGKAIKRPVMVQQRPIATLICYELAYPDILRQQLPLAQWIVSISDDGWFGHSLAMYQQLQMAQALSIQTGRYQIVSNNDGLSSVINDKGEFVSSLPAFDVGILNADIYPSHGTTPWVICGDKPFLLALFFFVVIACQQRRMKIRASIS